MKICQEVKRQIRKITGKYKKSLVPKYGKITADAIMSVEEFKEYRDWINGMNQTIFSFTQNELLILFCSYDLKWGRRKIRTLTGLSERFCDDTIRKLKRYDYKVEVPQVKEAELGNFITAIYTS